MCSIEEIPPGSARGYAIAGRQVIVVRSSADTVAVFLNRCPHLGVPLHWERDDFLDLEGTFLRCATHGALFEKDSGLCVLGPCRGESLWSLDSALVDGAVTIDESELPPPPDTGQNGPYGQY